MRPLAFVLSVVLGCVATSREATAWHRVPAPPPTTAPCAGCAALPPPFQMTAPVAAPPVAAVPAADDPAVMLREAIPQAAPGARRVLAAMQTMLDEGVVVRGSCNRWVEEVFRRAGGRARTVYSAGRRAPFTDTALLRPGDWVQFINHAYEGVTHSAVFVGWTDPSARVGMTASYPGQNRDAPGRFRDYDLSNVYRVVRLDDAPAAPPTRVRRR
ncbi:MAG: hypothetical protein U0325_19020 [Polyangiales bacterium]